MKKLFLFFVLAMSALLVSAQTNYLTFTARDVRSYFFMSTTDNVPFKPVVEYSRDGGNTWQVLGYDNRIFLDPGESVQLRGDNPKGMVAPVKKSNGTLDVPSTSRYNKFNIWGNIEASGSVMSLIDNTGMSEVIPTHYCFAYLFYNCVGLTKAPELPATTLKGNAYRYMFAETPISSTPELPALEVPDSAYSYMFYHGSDNRKLKEVGYIAAQKLGIRACDRMFYNNAGLNNVPDLEVTDLSNYSCSYMFYGCSTLVEAPYLPAAIGREGSYEHMFENCIRLRKIRVGLTSYSGTTSWVNRVAPQGEFIAPAALNSEISDAGSYMPAGWTRGEKYLAFYACHYSSTDSSLVTYRCSTDVVVTLKPVGFPTAKIEYSKDFGRTWYELRPMTPAQGKVVYLRGNNTSLASDANNYLTLEVKPYETSKNPYIYAYGSVMSLLDRTGQTTHMNGTNNFKYLFRDNRYFVNLPELPATQLTPYCYEGMFCNNSGTYFYMLPDTLLPATTLAPGCYKSMFERCTTMTVAPKLPALSPEPACYQSMFKGCTNIKKAPELPAVTLKEDCYSSMFEDCSLLNYIKVGFSSWEEGTTTDWVKNVSLSGTFEAPVALPNIKGDSNVPTGWVADDNDPDYLTFTAVSGESYIWMYRNSSSFTPSVEYSLDGGASWNPLTLSTSTSKPSNSGATIRLITLQKGQSVKFRGVNSTYSSNTSNYVRFVMAGYSVEASGNVMSLILNSDYSFRNAIPNNYCFYYLFYNCTTLTTAPKLPATALTDYCYYSMFSSCTSLTEAPELPAQTLADYCYYYMFSGCSYLQKAPELPAQQMKKGCYSYMFNACTSGLREAPDLPAMQLAESCYYGMLCSCSVMVKAPELPATNLAKSCYYNMFYNCYRMTTPMDRLPALNVPDYGYCAMFYGCQSLQKTPELPATTVGSNAYRSMFYNCTGLNNMPYLPATTISDYSYYQMFYGCTSLKMVQPIEATDMAPYACQSMFYGCTSLKEAPELPAMNLADYCYSKMFYNCSTLTAAPYLPATTMRPYCYESMFYNCVKLNYIHVAFGTWTPQSTGGYATSSWVTGVSPQGIFEAPPTLAEEYGANRIPTTWNHNYLKLTSSATSSYYVKVYLKRQGNPTHELNIEASTDGITWYKLVPDSTGSANATKRRAGYVQGLNVYLRGVNPTFNTNFKDFYYLQVSNTGSYSVNMSGSITSLLDGDGMSGMDELPDYCFSHLFYKSTYLYDFRTLLPFTNLSKGCYAGMFEKVAGSNLRSPELPAMELADSCYAYMFYQCTSMCNDSVSYNNAPLLPATTLAPACYAHMFDSCISSSFTKVPALPAMVMADNAYHSMFKNCTYLYNNGYLSGTTRYKYLRTLPATTLAPGCYAHMFENCYRNMSSNAADTMYRFTYFPELPATVMADSCYAYMFKNVLYLRNNPILPATVLAPDCYKEMFSGCRYLHGIQVGFDTWTDASYMSTSDWLLNAGTRSSITSSTVGTSYGRFYSPDSLAEIYDDSHIPVNWMQKLPDNSYLTLTNSSSTSQTVKLSKTGSPAGDFAYSLDNGITWTNYTAGNSITVPANQSVCLKARTTNPILSKGTSSYWYFTLSGTFPDVKWYASGNIMSLVDGEGNDTTLTIPCEYCFFWLFKSCANLVSAPEMPATRLKPYCYRAMFWGCTNLKEVQDTLAAAVIPNYAYKNMFYNCYNMIKAPKVIANVYKTGCCQGMFRSCTRIETATELITADSLYTYACDSMFYSCNRLRKAPDISVHVIRGYACNNMFFDCDSIKHAPLITADSIGDKGCYAMFNACSWLEDAPELPATKLGEQAYRSMFLSCSRLKTIPQTLPAPVVRNYTYYQMFKETPITQTPQILANTVGSYGCASMFYNCASLKNAEDLIATKVSANGYESMFYGCTGLVTPPNIQSQRIGSNGCKNMFQSCTNLVDMPRIDAPFIDTYGCHLMFNGCTKLKNVQSLTADTVCECGYREMFLGCTALLTAPALLADTIGSHGCREMFSGCTNLTTGCDLPATKLSNYCYYRMFAGCISLTTAGTISAPSLPNYACYNMYNGCNSLTTVPDLPATIVGTRTYAGMFSGCISLVTAPTISAMSVYDRSNTGKTATTLATYACDSMFCGCTALMNIQSELPMITIGEGTYARMFRNCSKLTYAPTIKATVIPAHGCRYMFNGCVNLTTVPDIASNQIGSEAFYYAFGVCTSLQNAPALLATSVGSGAYNYMFSGCTSLQNAPALLATSVGSVAYNNMFSGCTALRTLNVNMLQWSDYTTNWVDGVPTTGTFYANGSLPEEYGISRIPTGWEFVQPLYFKANEINCTVTLVQQGSWTPTVQLEYSADGVIWQDYVIGSTLQLGAPGAGVAFRAKTAASSFSESATNYLQFQVQGNVTVQGRVNSLIDPTAQMTTIPCNYCFYRLFAGNTTLRSTVKLTATTLKDYCYAEMFNGCSLVDVIDVAFPEWYPTATDNWVAGVAPSGQFTGPVNLPQMYSDSHIPTSWGTVSMGDYLCFTAQEPNVTVQILKSSTNANVPTLSLQYSYDKINWVDFMTGDASQVSVVVSPVIALPNTGDKVYMRAQSTNARTHYAGSPASYPYYNSFILTGKVAASGNCFSLLNREPSAVTAIPSYAFCRLFTNCSTLTEAPELPVAGTAYSRCYSYMFEGCTNLTKVPSILPATTLDSYCYADMFLNCSSLETAPELPAWSLVDNCYYQMFMGCTNLNYIKVAFTTAFNTSYTSDWVNGVQTTSGTFVKPAGLAAAYGNYQIPTNWQTDDSNPQMVKIMFHPYLCTGYMADQYVPKSVATPLNRCAYTRLGYHFNVWSLNSDGSVSSTNYADGANINTSYATRDLYPTWTANTYSIKYDGNGATGGSMTNTTGRSYNTSYSLKANAYTRTGYTFAGWAESPDGPLVYTDQQSYINLASEDGAVVTLYAVWKVNSYIVIFNPNGADGSPVVLRDTFECGSYHKIRPCTYTRLGYTFRKWNNKTDSTGAKNLFPGDSVIDLKTSNYDTYNLYAAWKANTYYIRYDNNAPNVTGSLSLTPCTYNVQARLRETSGYISRTGYTFAGWAETPTGPVKYVNRAYVTNLSSEQNDTITIYAVWTPITYYIQFYGNGNNSGTMANQTLYYDSLMQLTPNAFQKDGHKFKGWSKTSSPGLDAAIDFTDTAWVKNLKESAGTTQKLYAVWRYRDYELTWDVNGGDPLPGDYTKGETPYNTVIVRPKASPTREGYTFTGWKDLVTGDTAIVPKMPKNDLTYTAQWIANPTTDEYFTLTAVDDNSKVTLTYPSYNPNPSLEYSTDGGTTWNPYKVGTTGYVTLQAGQKVCFRATKKLTQFSTGTSYYAYFSISQGRFMASGKLMYLIDPTGQTKDIPNNYCFYHLFSGCGNGLISADNLILDAERLSQYCYYEMFINCYKLPRTAPMKAIYMGDYSCYGMYNNCKSLLIADTLWTANLASGCYYYMFSNCTSLPRAAAIMADEMATSACAYMYNGCTSLVSAPDLNASILKSNCYESMFTGCTKLQTAPAIRALRGADASCYRMFYNCTSLTSSPDLTLSAVRPSEYSYMFYNCTSLRQAPRIWADSIGSYGCLRMFYFCTGLKSSPDLAATRLGNYCYRDMFRTTGLLAAPAILSDSIPAYGCNDMFRDCDSMSYSPDLPATRLGNYCYLGMFTQSQGNFKTAPAIKAIFLPPHACDSMFYNCDQLTTVPDLTPITISDNACQCMFESCTSLVAAPAIRAKQIKNYGCYNMFRSCKNLVSSPDLACNNLGSCAYYYMFVNCYALQQAPSILADSIPSSGCAYMFSNCTTLTATPQLQATRLAESAYDHMFEYCYGLTSASDLPAKVVRGASYYHMFRNCTSLVSAPKMYADTIGQNGCTRMFYGCSSLKHVPDLTAQRMGTYCYSWMFDYCTALDTAPAIVVDSLPSYACWRMFNQCSSLVYVPDLQQSRINTATYCSMFANCSTLTMPPAFANRELKNYCYDSMYLNCLSLQQAPALPYTQLKNYCYRAMFYNCTTLTEAPQLPAPTRGTASYAYQGMFNYCSHLNFINMSLADWYTDYAFTTGWVNGVALEGTFIASGSLPQTRGTSYIPTNWRVIQPLSLTAEEANCVVTLEKIGNWTPSVQLVYAMAGEPWQDYTIGTPISLSKVGSAVTFAAKTTNASFSESATNYLHFAIQGNVKAQGEVMSLLDQTCQTTTIPSAYCFYRLFADDSTLTAAPVLSATTLTDYCYAGMFSGCKLISALDVAFQAWSPANATEGWVANVAPSGTFKCPDDLEQIYSDDNIPTDWAAKTDNVLYFEAEQANSTVSFLRKNTTNAPYVKLQYSTDGVNWTPFTSSVEGITITLPNVGDRVYFKAQTTNSAMCRYDESTSYNYFAMTGQVAAYGSIMSLLNAIPANASWSNNYTFSHLFDGCTALTRAPELPASTYTRCYYYMFKGCTGLTEAPALPSTSLYEACYLGMFQNCTGLTEAPELMATSLASYCYEVMFDGCINLNHIKVGFTSWTTSSVSSNWVRNVAPTGTFECPSALTKTYDATHIPVGWGTADVDQQYIIYYKPNGGTGNMANQVMVGTDNQPLSKNTFQRTGYTFLGWSTSSSATTATYTDEQSVAPKTIASSGTQTLYAVWKANKYYVKYHTIESDVTGTMSVSTFTYDAYGYLTYVDVSKAPSTPIGRSGYTFIGWTNTPGGEKLYSNQEYLKNLTSVNLDTIHLYALWRPNVYYVSYQPSSYKISSSSYVYPTGSMKPDTVNYGEDYQLKEHLYTMRGYKFVGWGTSSPSTSTTTTKWQETEVVNNLTKTDKGTYYVYAMWRPDTLQLTWDVNGGDPLTGTYTSGAVVYNTTITKPANPTRQGYIFVGWSQTPPTYMPDTNLTLVAQWIEDVMRDYLYLEAATANSKFSIVRGGSYSYTYPKFQVSTDNGATWTNYTVSSTGTIILPNVGDRAYIRAQGTNEYVSQGTSSYYTTFSRSAGTFKVGGNVMSLLDASCESKKIYSANNDYCFGRLFNGLGSYLTSAEDLRLPATELDGGCYANMFEGCSGMIEGPRELPAPIANGSAYYNMFNGCTKMKNMPTILADSIGYQACYQMFYNCDALTSDSLHDLTAQHLGDYAYYYMFYEADGITTTPNITADSLPTYACSYMFYGCDGLISAQPIPATRLGSYACSYMFASCTKLASTAEMAADSIPSYACQYMYNGCTSLTMANPLPATRLGNYAYRRMFAGCTKLQKAPKISATNYGTYACWHMFDGCTSMTYSPDLTIHNMKDYAMGFMFMNCSSLVSTPRITADTIAPFGCWRMFVSCTGLNADSVKDLTTTRLGYSAYQGMFANCNGALFTHTPRILADKLPSSCCDSMFYNCTKLTSAADLPATTAGNECYYAMFANCLALKQIPNIALDSIPYNGCGYMFYRCTTLTSIPDLTASKVMGYGYQHMFSCCSTKLTVTPKILADTIGEYGCYGMYEYCYALQTATSLPTVQLGEYCYHYMFNTCTTLTQAPDTLPCMKVPGRAYYNMFISCSNLTKAPFLPATQVGSSSYRAMFSGCVKLVDFQDTLYARTLSTYSYQEMFSGCTLLPKAPVIMATNTGSSYCLQSMFSGCPLINEVRMYGNYMGDSYSKNWLSGVATVGTFYGSAKGVNNIRTLTRNEHTVPAKWTIMQPLSFIATTGTTVSLDIVGSWTPTAELVYFVDGVEKPYTYGTKVTLAPGQVLTFQANPKNASFSQSATNYMQFHVTGTAQVVGTVMSLLDAALDEKTIPNEYCFYRLFAGCDAITTGPELTATTLADHCYEEMFNGCSNMTTLQVSFDEWSPATATTDWVKNVAPTGEFTSPDALPLTEGDSNVPTGWAGLSNNYLCFTAAEAGSTVRLLKNSTSAPTLTLQYSRDGYEWTDFTTGTSSQATATVSPVITLDNVGDKVYFRAKSSNTRTHYGGTSDYYNYFVMTGQIEGSGNVLSLLTPTPNLTTSLSSYAFMKLFYNCSALTTPPDVPSSKVTLYDYCYYGMFQNCTGLTSAPELPATQMYTYCYAYMFDGCTSLETAPELPARNLSTYCYYYMFRNCSTLTEAPALPATSLSNYCYQYMFYNCANLNHMQVNFTGWSTTYTSNWVNGVQTTNGTFVKPSGLSATYGVSNIPTNWGTKDSVMDVQTLVRFDANGGVGHMNDQMIKGANQTLNANQYTWAGHTFNKWCTSATGNITTSNSYADEATVSAATLSSSGTPITLYARWNSNQYVVRFNKNDESGSTRASGSMTVQNITYDVATSLKNIGFSRTGYNFSGWALSPDGEKVYANQGTVQYLSAIHLDTVDLYAVWTPYSSSYYISYYLDSKPTKSYTQYFPFDKKDTLMQCQFVKTGYHCIGWTTEYNNATKKRFEVNDSMLFNYDTVFTGSKRTYYVVYPIWESNPYTVHFDANADDAVGSMDDVQMLYATAQYLPANQFTRVNYTFLGWSLDPTATEADYRDKQAVKNLTEADSEATLYAIWQGLPYTVHFEANATGVEGSMADQTAYYNTATPLSKNAYTRANYDFAGWATSTMGSKVYDDEDMITQPLTSGTYTLYALWNEAMPTMDYTTSRWTSNSIEIDMLAAVTTVSTQVGNGEVKETALDTAQTDVAMYNIPTESLIGHGGETLTILFYNQSGELLAKNTEVIPFIPASGEQNTQGWDAATCATTDLVVPNGSVLEISSNLTFKRVDIMGGAKILIPSGITLTVDSIILHSGEVVDGVYQYTYPQLMVEGLINIPSTYMYYDYLLNKKQQYNLATPFNIDRDDIKASDGSDLTFKIAAYDGAVRAQGQSGWGYTEEKNLQGGTGYTTFATTKKVTPEGGTSTRREYVTMRIPMYVGAVYYNEKEKSVPISLFSGNHVENSGWNLIANPYLTNYKGVLTINKVNQTSVTIPNDQGTGYVTKMTDKATLPAFHAFFIQTATSGRLLFGAANRQRKGAMEEDYWRTALDLKNGNDSDIVNFLMGDGYTESYEINSDATKMANQGMNVYATVGPNSLSVAAVPTQYAKNGIAIAYSNLSTSKAYTFQLDPDFVEDADDFLALNLTDNVTGVTTNLLVDQYTFTPLDAASTTRFVLTVVFKQLSPTTDTENIRSDEDAVTKTVDKYGVMRIRKAKRLYNAQGANIK